MGDLIYTMSGLIPGLTIEPGPFEIDGAVPSTPYDKTAVTYSRGGNKASFTQRFLWDCPVVFDPAIAPPSKQTFKRVLQLSDGDCGAACDTATRTAWLQAQAGKEGPGVQFVTFGGVGGKAEDTKKTLS